MLNQVRIPSCFIRISYETFFELRTIFRNELNHSGLTDFDVSVATSEKRILTRAIGGWAYEAGYQGIRYLTRHAPELHCWAVFEGASFEIVDKGSAITLADEDLLVVAKQWNLPLPKTSRTDRN